MKKICVFGGLLLFPSSVFSAQNPDASFALFAMLNIQDRLVCPPAPKKPAPKKRNHNDNEEADERNKNKHVRRNLTDEFNEASNNDCSLMSSE